MFKDIYLGEHAQHLGTPSLNLNIFRMFIIRGANDFEWLIPPCKN